MDGRAILQINVTLNLPCLDDAVIALPSHGVECADVDRPRVRLDPLRDHQERLGLPVGGHRVGHRAKWCWSPLFSR